MGYSYRMILASDCLLRCPAIIDEQDYFQDASKGADLEEGFCVSQGIPVFYDIASLYSWVKPDIDDMAIYDKHWLLEAYKIAASQSSDPRTQNGAIIVSGNKVIAADGNHFPANVEENPFRWERSLKAKWVEHEPASGL